MTRRDERLFVEFVAAHQERLRRAAFLITGDWASADDVTQEALVRLYVAMPRLGDLDSPMAYARRTVVNVAIDAARKRGTRERYEAREPVPPPSPDVAGAYAERTVVVAALEALAPRQRAVVVLRYFEDLSVEQTAQVMGCSPGTVKSQTARGLDTLRHALVEAGWHHEVELEVSE
ncbi:SigE family RNA polymerase sigma factor [Nocardioides sp. HDW12B]|uniref:SigE family RNA polymerase sigma factor n=1 Tax=Nocardioides sp. HDW12B TaxID=2714939 RepID=UPI00140792E6|nr:SigE family RNA polymerase sigma factor [Nocardioides sp. HDW12B]QIK65886.1 SigE family RNA polymerase sigma factor [Nocardioides sp. HDW12B]